MLRTTLGTLLAAVFCAVLSRAQVTTSQYDNARTGANINETILTPQNVNSQQFGKLVSYKVEGSVYAQLLYLPGVEIPGKGLHNVVFVATEHDSVYAFDADGKSPEPLWEVSFISDFGVSTVPVKDLGRPCTGLEAGITATPVIDLKTGTLYVVARTKERKGLFSDYEYVQRLHALAITTGAEKFGGPVVIHASVPGSGENGSNGKVDFNPLRENSRAALLLVNNTLYLSWGSICDVRPYHGWMMAYDAQTLTQKAVFNVTPDSAQGGIWMGDSGPAADKDGNVFVPTANGRFNAATGGRDYGNTVLKLGFDQGLVVRDYFTPSNQEELDINDEDLGSGGPVLLADQPGTRPHLLFVAGKGGTIYLIDRDVMGKFKPGSDSHAVQAIPTNHHGFGAPAAWIDNVYHLLSNDVLRHYKVVRGKLALKASAAGKPFGDPGATPGISANGNKDGIVWVVEWKGWRKTDPPSVLHAYDAANITREIYNSEQNSARDELSRTLRYAIPTIANGHVYVGAANQLDIYGLLPSNTAKK